MARGLLIPKQDRTEWADETRLRNQIQLLMEDVMSVQKKSLISQRSAVKSALLATTATSNLKPATKSSVKPALSNKVATALSHRMAVRPSIQAAKKAAVRGGG